MTRRVRKPNDAKLDWLSISLSQSGRWRILRRQESSLPPGGKIQPAAARQLSGPEEVLALAPPPADTREESSPSLLESLTAKQREVLDLLIEHRTSKEISRLLGISPHTVDQRIMFARAKLNVATRGEVAQVYRRLLAEREVLQPIQSDQAIYERSVYGLSRIVEAASAGQVGTQEDMVAPPTGTQPPQDGRKGPLPMERAEAGISTGQYHRVLPELFDGPNGTLVRLSAIALIAASLILIMLGSLAMIAQLSDMSGR
ncbi:helix-turn-helix transcriptional regulator [Novosphingobium sp. FKTRR1]|uniref:helix-turn-helix domain-containing protein n=1 Tax=Novosphingobium sp. FKTRR1 TaxID=2879118 RepID=UPI001CF09584|nr:helix-turn-helix transcriptional regulator [Novosphingobium sp. FKTRR1]